MDLQYELIAISDYNKGFLSESDIEHICSLHPNVFLDTKKKISGWAMKAKFIKINAPEYNQSENFILQNLTDKVIKTDGKNGAWYQHLHFPTHEVEVRDVSGAGDTFFAGLCAKFLEEGDIEESIRFANLCASKVVQKRGVCSI